MGSPPGFGALSLAALATLSISAGGCSLFLVNGPPPNHRTLSFFGCTSSNSIPGIDTAIGAGAVVEALVNGTGSSGGTTNDRLATAVTYGATAALFAASAAYGFRKTSECR